MTAELEFCRFLLREKDIIKSTGLLSSVVENILIQCIGSCSMDKLSLKIQRKFKLPNTLLKQYLFYQIECGFVSYDGQSNIFKTQKIGREQLFVFN